MEKRKLKRLKNKKEIKKDYSDLKFFIFLILIFIIVISLIYIFYNFVSVYRKTKYDVYLIVDDKLGFDVSPDYIHFGKVPPNCNATKKVYVYNNEDKKYIIQLKLKGNVSQFIYVEEFSPILMPKENKTLIFHAIVPANASYGYYSGELEIIFRRF